MLIVRYPAYLLLLLWLSGCGTISGMFKDEDNADPPTPLAAISSSITVNKVWSKNVGSTHHAVNLQPIHVNQRLYAASQDGTVTALDYKSGDIEWQINTQSRLGGGPGVGDDLVLLGTREGEVIALAADKGKELWRSRVTSEVLSVPIAVAGIVVARSIDGRLFGLSTANGSRLWTYDRTVPVLTLRGSSSPTLAGGLIIYGSDGGKLTAISLKEGLPIWEKSVAYPSGRSELDRIVDIDGDPLVINGVIYAASYQGVVVALDLETGGTIWSKELATSTDMSADESNIYVTDSDGNVWALDRRSGAALWKQDKLRFRNVTGPAVDGRHIVVADLEGYLHWLSVEDGSLVGRAKTGSVAINIPPLVVDGLVYSYSLDGELSVYTVK